MNVSHEEAIPLQYIVKNKHEFINLSRDSSLLTVPRHAKITLASKLDRIYFVLDF